MEWWTLSKKSRLKKFSLFSLAKWSLRRDMTVYASFQASQKHGATEVPGKTLGQEQLGVNSLLYSPFILGCIRRSTASRSREVILPQRCWGHTWNAVSSLGLPVRKRDRDIMETVQWRATKMIKGLEHLLRRRAETTGAIWHGGEKT